MKYNYFKNIKELDFQQLDLKIKINWEDFDIRDLSIEVSKILIKMLSIKEKESKIYNGASLLEKNKNYIRTWEFRNPLKGEYFISWCIPEVYKAFYNMDTKYHIVKQKK